MFEQDARPNTYVNDVTVDKICKQVADKYGLEWMPKIAYGIVPIPNYSQHITIDYSSAGFTQPPVFVATLQNYSESQSNFGCYHLTSAPSLSSAVIAFEKVDNANQFIYWMAMGT